MYSNLRQNIKISVILATFNRMDSVIDTLEGLRCQTLNKEEYEVIIVDDCSTDETAHKVNDYIRGYFLKQWKYVRNDGKKGHPGAINKGISCANSVLLAFIDDDIVPVPEWLESHLSCQKKYNFSVAVVGSIKYPDDWIKRSNLVRYHNSTYLGQNRMTGLASKGVGMPPKYLSGGNFSVPKYIIEKIGFFNEDLWRGNDTELGIRLVNNNIKIIYEPHALVVHYSERIYDYDKWIKEFKNFYVESASYFISKYIDTYNRDFHWFVEKPVWFKESIIKSTIKLIIRLFARPTFGRYLLQLLKKKDNNTRFYIRPLYQYLLCCIAIEGVNERHAKKF